MRKEDAQAVAKKYLLPSKEVSKRIIKAIAGGKLEACESCYPLSRELLIRLADAYSSKVSELGGSPLARKLAFQALVEDRYPSLKTGNAETQPPHERYFRGTKPSTLALLLGLIPENELTTSANAEPGGKSLDSARIVSACEEFFARQQIERIGDEWIVRFIDWISKGHQGMELSILTPICPDYATEPSESGGFRYTFSGLGEGVGVAGQQLIDVLRSLHELIRNVIRPSSFSHAIYLADTEGFSAANLERLNLNETDFKSKVIESARAIRKRVPKGVAVSLFSDLCGGREGWLHALNGMRTRIGSGEFGRYLKKSIIRNIAEQRRSLYRRWYGKKDLTEPMLEALVINQIAEWAVTGTIISRAHENALIFGVGNQMLAPFYTIDAVAPTLCLCIRRQ